MEIDIQNMSGDGTLKNRKGVILDFRTSIKEFFLRYFRDDTDDMPFENEIEFVPSLSVCDNDNSFAAKKII